MSTPTTPSPSAFPVRLIAGVAALVVAIVVVLGVVLLTGGSADKTTPAGPTPSTSGSTPSALAAADAQFPGLVVQSDLSRNHASRGEHIDYPDAAAHPPLGGNHAAIWMNCQAYSAPIPTENAVHSLEHGAVWITYQPTLAAADAQALDALATPGTKVLVSPREQESPVILTAWGRQLRMTALDLPVVQRFVQTYVNGPQDPEPGASCDSPVNQPGTAPFIYTGSDIQPSTSTETVPAEGSIS